MAALARAWTRSRITQSGFLLKRLSAEALGVKHSSSGSHAVFCHSAAQEGVVSLPACETFLRTCATLPQLGEKQCWFRQLRSPWMRTVDLSSFRGPTTEKSQMKRMIHSSAESTHPWSRDKLAQRVAQLRQRRAADRSRKERFLRVWRDLQTDPLAIRPGTTIPSQPLVGVLQPRNPQEAKVAPLLARSDLIVTRNIEWANLLVGFEQANRYVIMDPREGLMVVGYIIESSHWLLRQFLHHRRPFTASIMDASGDVLFTVRRPAWFINSTIYAEIDGGVVGFAKRRWHLWKRIYDIYLGKRQFAVVENPGFWNWTFTLKDENGKVLGEIDRHFRGFGYEMLTDAGQYAIRFGDIAPAYHPKSTVDAMSADKSSLPQGINVNHEYEAETFQVDRPLSLSERAVALALAISLDNDHFSRHGGRFFPIPFVGGEE